MSDVFPTPRYVALCGAPKAGKSTIAGLLEERYGAKLIDDGAPLRRGVCELFADFGTKLEDAYTQKGKSKTYEVGGKTYELRQLLGDVGNLLEDKYGQNLLPKLGLAHADRLDAARSNALFYVFASCRKTQGHVYRQRGGVVVEVLRPGCKPVNDFDHYDLSAVTHTITNLYGLEELKHAVFTLFDSIYGGH